MTVVTLLRADIYLCCVTSNVIQIPYSRFVYVSQKPWVSALNDTELVQTYRFMSKIPILKEISIKLHKKRECICCGISNAPFCVIKRKSIIYKAYSIYLYNSQKYTLKLSQKLPLTDLPQSCARCAVLINNLAWIALCSNQFSITIL